MENSPLSQQNADYADEKIEAEFSKQDGDSKSAQEGSQCVALGRQFRCATLPPVSAAVRLFEQG